MVNYYNCTKCDSKEFKMIGRTQDYGQMLGYMVFKCKCGNRMTRDDAYILHEYNGSVQ